MENLLKTPIETIEYPEKYNPDNCPIFVRNEIHIQSTREKIWFWLTNATTWSEWYANSSNVQILNQDNNHLLAGTQFKWRTFKTNINSEVKDFRPYHSLAWEAKGTGLLAYHAWLIIPQEGGCKVITEETQQGWLPSLFGFFIKKGLLKQHQIWLEGLKAKAEADTRIQGLFN